jgi:hypothetical protein
MTDDGKLRGFTMKLTSRERDILLNALTEYNKSVQRKRSWRPSEKAVARAEASALAEHITTSTRKVAP